MIDRMTKKVEALQPQIYGFDWNSPAAYAEWLSQAFYIARRSTSYLGLCMFHSEHLPEFQKRCAGHIQEELGHEKLIMNDIKNLGQSLRPELGPTQAVYQTQYFRIVADDATSFLGYVFFLELLAPIYGAPLVEKIQAKNALSFLKVHARADEDHIESAQQVLAMLNREQQEKVWTNFEMTAGSYSAMLTEIARIHSGQVRHSKAA